MGPFIYQLQGFQVTFTTTVASTYTISTARDGYAFFQVSNAMKSVAALAAALYVPQCTLAYGSGAPGGAMVAGVPGQVLVYGRDVYGAPSLLTAALLCGQAVGRPRQACCALGTSAQPSDGTPS
jgi:hypothetical protein